MLKIWLFYGLVVYVIIPLFAITQIVIPTLRGRALFPLFRSRRRKLEQELAELRSGNDDALLEEEVKKEREKAVTSKKEREKAEEPQEKAPRTRNRK